MSVRRVYERSMFHGAWRRGLAGPILIVSGVVMFVVGCVVRVFG